MGAEMRGLTAVVIDGHWFPVEGWGLGLDLSGGGEKTGAVVLGLPGIPPAACLTYLWT